ncbi:MAG: N-acetyltransferase [Maritimibacter sp.]
MYALNEEKPDDWWEVEALYDLCFAPGREALSSYRLRDGVDPVAQLCLVARDAYGAVGGAIRYWPVDVGGASALLLGPVAVHPTHQGEGLGGLMDWRCWRDISAHSLSSDHSACCSAMARDGARNIKSAVSPTATAPNHA